ncbi:OPT oligopeptide transporter protein-domain-containing protein [Lipomyces oligophaga]|uniref:OPT oligopeptide transporter protein-domain-containing protein n=1 Tax=Lipomyces oligophaga TaxID=45792 RepID=UPI0034CEB728
MTDFIKNEKTDEYVIGEEVAEEKYASLSESDEVGQIYSKDNADITVANLDIQDLRERAIERLRNDVHKDLADLFDDETVLEYLLDMMTTVTASEAIEILTNAEEYHGDDNNFLDVSLQKIKSLLQGEEVYGQGHELYMLDLLIEATVLKFHSPYPEVRAVCSPMDDPNTPVETFRAYFLGMCWVAIGSFINQLFEVRQPSLTIGSTAIQIMIYPCGQFLAKVLPDWGFTAFGSRHSLNPGPWNNKEQMLATLMVNVGSTSSNFMDYVLVMKLARFFNQTWVNFGFIFLMNFSTQFFGFGLAGLLRRWVVYPAKAIWPSLLPTVMLNRVLLLPEDKHPVNGWSITRYKFFFIILGGMMLYYWLPGFIFTALSTFNWMTWIAPNNVNLATVTGSNVGVGLNPLTTFDWGVISYSAPLAVPFFSIANQWTGMMISALIMLGLYYRNYKWMGYLPINSTSSFDNTGSTYNASRIVNEDLTLNVENYKNYSPPFLSIGYVMIYGSEFVMFTMSVIYIWLAERKALTTAFGSFYRSIRNRKSSNFKEYDDVFCRLMSKYPEVPDWWYICILGVSLAFAIIAVEVYDTNTPWWSVVVIIAICIFLIMPSAIIFSVTGYQLGFNDIAIIVVGYMVPEHAIANMICRVFGWNVDAQAESLIGDQKLGHYAKIPPRALLRGQLMATMIQTFITIAAYNVLVDSMDDLCSDDQPNNYICPFANALYTATLVWGVVGPKRIFNTLYPMLKWAFLIGVCIAAPVFYLRLIMMRYIPAVKNWNPIMTLAGMSSWNNGYNLAYYTPGMEVSFVFMYYIRHRYLAWWTRYNYVLSAALSAGVALCAILVFVSLQITNVSIPWWGTDVSNRGVEGGNIPSVVFTLQDGETFGPKQWS